MTKEIDYGSDDIQVLEGLEAVRKRPGMYIGTTAERGLHHLVWEIVDNAIDEALAGFCNEINIKINKDNSITVIDNGRGIPVEEHKKTGLSTVETVYTILHAGGKFGGKSYKVSGGLHGVGASVVNALSKYLEVTVYKAGKIYYIRFENGGKTVAPLKVIGECSLEKTGTMVTFDPDDTIFTETTIYNYEILKTRIRELAFLNRGLKIILIDNREVDKKDVFLYEGGIKEYIKYLNKNKTPLTEDIIYCEGEEDNIVIEVAFQYNDGYTVSVYSFANNINTHDGGTHEEGVRNALTRVINKYATNIGVLKDKDEMLTGDDVREGLTMIISTKIPDPQFEGQTKGRLGNAEVRKIASDIFGEGFDRFLMENPDSARKIIEKSLMAARARLAAKRAREASRKKNDNDFAGMLTKLTDCSLKGKENHTELFLVEGNSAAGSAISGRDARTQAVLALRGKILNVEKARIDKAFANEEIKNLITALGTGIGDEFDSDRLRYEKIIIMADADVDGEHIRTLLLTLFYRFFRPLVEEGYIYAAQPPLYKITYGKDKWSWAVDDKDRDAFIETLKGKKHEVSRNKGLGEMNADELCDTTMNPEHRTLLKISLEDAVAANQIFETLMGDEVEPRRQFIEENASYANIDI